MAHVNLPEAEHSYWLDSIPASNYRKLIEDIECDVVIVGGGIAGLSVAYRLKEAGRKVVILEKNTIASGTTGGTTGKLTTQHGLIYAELVQHFGESFTKRYVEVCQRAFEDIERLVTTKKIECDWHRADNYVYTADKGRAKTLQEEVAVAARMGLPASYETYLGLPFETVGAVKFADQAYFNAAKYVRALADLVEGDGSHVFEHSEAKSMREGRDRCIVETREGQVSAEHMIIATKVPAGPLVGRMTYAGREYPVTSYIVAGTYDGDLQGMYISPDKSHYSLLPIDTPDGRMLLVGGESHLPGIKRSTPKHQKLADYAARQFDVTDIRFRWKAMDYLAYDSIPLIGPLYPASKRTYMIGGFKKWGLNLSMVAANILTDAIVGSKETDFRLFTPHRFSAPASFPKAVVKYFQ
jgi:glycine/D-amino acid oxidase-like deaminating enzyme